MPACRYCKGSGTVPDLSWCGRPCCPAYMKCLPCDGTGRRRPRGDTDAT